MAGLLISLDFFIHDTTCRLLHIANELNIVRTTKEGTSYQHRHPAFELYYITAGQCSLAFNKKNVSIRAQQLLIIPPGVYHSTKSHSPDISGMTVTFDLTATEQTARKTGTQFSKSFSFTSPILLDVGPNLQSPLAQLRVLSQIKNPTYLHLEKMRSLCSLLLLEMHDALTQQELENHAAASPAPLPQDYTIDAFFAYHYNRNNGSPVLAQKLNVSPRQLNRIIKKTYGLNYREKLREIRLEIATDFLTTSNKSVSEIAELLGYSCPANFSSFIKNATGKTPTQIRREARNTRNH